MTENFIYRHECEFSSGGGRSEEDFYINNRDTFSSDALLCLQFFLESEWQNFRGTKQAESSCAFIGLIHTGTQKRVTEDGEYEIKAGDLILERESQKVLYTQAMGKEILRRTGIIIYRNTFFDNRTEGAAGQLLDWMFPGQEDIHQDTDAENVGAPVAVTESVLFRSGVTDRAKQPSIPILCAGAGRNSIQIDQNDPSA